MYPIEHIDEVQHPLPCEGIYLNCPERQLLWEVLRIPPDSPYAEYAIPLFLQFHECCCAFEPGANIYHRRQRQVIASQLEQLQLTAAETLPPSLPPANNSTRILPTIHCLAHYFSFPMKRAHHFPTGYGSWSGFIMRWGRMIIMPICCLTNYEVVIPSEPPLSLCV